MRVELLACTVSGSETKGFKNRDKMLIPIKKDVV